jgi:transcriptional regulator with XRE-family HTH domain
VPGRVGVVPAEVQAQFGERIRELRTSRGMTQAQLAYVASLHPTYVSGIERGLRNVALVNIVMLARALGVDSGHLFESPRKR